jgi:hypothetical protein
MGLIATKGWKYRGVPDELILKLKLASNYDDFIETGTYKGDTSKWASKYFNNVFTIEASEIVYKKLNFNSYPNITSIFGNSVEHLDNILNNNSIIYLDAHYSGRSTFNSYPLLLEIDRINNSNLNHIIIIDDARFCLSFFNDENYTNIIDLCFKLNNFKNKRYIVIFDDLIISVPILYKKIVDEYCNDKSRSYYINYLNSTFYLKLKYIFRKYFFKKFII